MTDTPAPKPSFNQAIATAINNDSQRADPIVQARFVESSRDLQRQRLTAQPSQPTAGKPPPTLDDFVKNHDFSKSFGGTQPVADGTAPAVGSATDGGATPTDSAAATAAETATIDPTTVPDSPEGYQLTLPPDLPPDIEVNESYTNQIREFAHANKMPQSMMDRMVAAVVKNDVAKIQAERQEFERSANAVVAAVGKDRVLAVGAFLDKSASTPAAANALKAAMRTGGVPVVELFERMMRSSNSGQSRQPIEMLRGIWL